MTAFVIAVEEHFMHPALSGHFTNKPPPSIAQKLFDYGQNRIAEMDAAGIDLQVLSHQSPGSQQLPDEVAISACQTANDALAVIIASVPDRFAGFAMLPTEDPDAAVDELSRAVLELGLKGAMIHGRSAGNFMDAARYWKIFAAAEALGVPIYMHPSEPDDGIIESLLAPYDTSHPALKGPAWAFGLETSTHAIRLVLSGLFERHPDLQIILGHMGEALPFWLPRIEEALARPGNRTCDFGAHMRQNFYVTTSGFFSTPALRCCLDEIGHERVLFAVDHPYASSKQAVAWLRQVPIPDNQRDAIFSGNTQRLLQMNDVL